jgi:hypothetical protein
MAKLADILRKELNPVYEECINEQLLAVVAVAIRNFLYLQRHVISEIKSELQLQLTQQLLNENTSEYEILRRVTTLPTIDCINISSTQLYQEMLIELTKLVQLFNTPVEMRVWQPSPDASDRINDYKREIEWMVKIICHYSAQHQVHNIRQLVNLENIEEKHLTVFSKPPSAYTCSTCGRTQNHWAFQCNQKGEKPVITDELPETITKFEEVVTITRSADIYHLGRLWNNLEKTLIQLSKEEYAKYELAVTKEKQLPTNISELADSCVKNIPSRYGNFTPESIAERHEKFGLFMCNFYKTLQDLQERNYTGLSNETLQTLDEARQVMVQLLALTLLKSPKSLDVSLKTHIAQTMKSWIKVKPQYDEKSGLKELMVIQHEFIEQFAAVGIVNRDYMFDENENFGQRLAAVLEPPKVIPTNKVDQLTMVIAEIAKIKERLDRLEQ